MAENLKLAKALRQAEMRPTPRSGMTGMLADALMGARNFADRAKVPDFVPLIGGEGVGSLLVGKAPEEVNEMSYGNSPIQMNPYAGRTASFVPEMKRGRGQQLADALSLLSLPGGKTAASMMMGAVPGVDAAATVYHGSPHKFDRFDFSKIGTGEGAQAYGHGGYLADARATGEEYRRALAGKDQGMAGQIAANALRGRTPESAIDALSLNLVGVTPEARAMTQQAIDLIKQGDANQGYLYKVDLPDEAIARMLDWDKPLNQQAPEVQAALTPEALGLQYQQLPNGNHAFVNAQGTRVGNMQKGGTSDSFRTNWLDSVANSRLSGREVYQSINDGMFGADKAAAALRQAGIPGIRYLDGGSRGAGSGTSNYVVFPGNESLLTILERNNQPLGIK